MPKAIRIHKHGGPEVLKWEDCPMPEPGEGEVLIRQKAVGLNYIDIYNRTGLYPIQDFPAILGYEGSGVVEKLGPNCEIYKVGDRVAYAGGPMGSYARYRAIHEQWLAKIPDALNFEHAAGVMLKGLTAHYLVRRTFNVRPGVVVLIHAAAGGVGLLLTQWCKHLGASVIGTVGSKEKAELVKQNGCDVAILYKEEDIAKRVREVTDGRGVNVVYDSVGKDTFMASLDSLMHFGLLVSYGQSSGPVPPFDISLLSQKGSLFLTRPTLFHYKQQPAEHMVSCMELFGHVEKGVLRPVINHSYYLSDAARAHRELESRKTTGSTILVVD